MTTKLIELENGILVEVDAREGESYQISGSIAKRIGANLEKIQPVLVAVSQTIAEAWEAINKDLKIEKATVELGLSFEGEGNIFITKAKAGANLIITLELKSKDK